MRVAEPARAEVPAGGGAGAQIAVEFAFVALRRFFRGIDVIQPGFGARHVARVPVAVKHGAVRQLDNALACLPSGDAIAVRHPVVILFLQLRQIFAVGRVALVGRQQIDHQAKEGRLRAAEIVAAVAVRDMAVGIQLPREVIHHILYTIPVSALGQAEHGEIAVPVVDLAEAAARHYVGLRQRQQRIVAAGAFGGARQHRPQAVDMRAQALPGGRHIFFARGGQGKVAGNETLQIEVALIFLHLPVCQNRRGIEFRHRVGEGFLVGIELRLLHRAKQRPQPNIRRLRLAAEHT